MKHMTCINHKEAYQICLNPGCKSKCAYLCADMNDSCCQQHQACCLANLPYIYRKYTKITFKGNDIEIPSLVQFLSSIKKVVGNIDNFVQSFNILTNIKNALDPHGFIDGKQKDIIQQFMNSKLNNEFQFSLATLERDLKELNFELVSYMEKIRKQRQKEEEERILREVEEKQIQNKSKINRSRLKQSSSGIKASSSKGNKEGFVQSSLIESPTKKYIAKPPFFSKITNDVQTINKYFSKKFIDVKLLYRASQNEFSCSKFHQKCNGFTNTITFVLTEYDKIIGGFTSLPWKSGGGQWYQDPEETTFLFSISSGQKYPLLNKSKAIWCSQAYGPSFGHPDLQIADKSNYNSNSCTNFPQCFNNGNYTNSTGTTQLFCGSKTGHFKIKEWQVYELIF